MLHYSAPPIIGGVEYTIAEHARLLADHGYPVQVIAGRGEQFDPRVEVRIIPTVDSKDPLVLAVNQELGEGVVTGRFHSLVSSLRDSLRSALAGVEICIAHNLMTLHKNLALTAALHEIAKAEPIRLIAWCHDFAWEDPVYADVMHPGMPWDLLRTEWARTRYVVVSGAGRVELARLLNIPEQEIAAVPPGVDAIQFLGIGQDASQFATQLDLLKADPILLSPTRVTRRKNIGLAIEITAALTRRGLNPKLVVMGPLGPHNPANAQYMDELSTLKRERGVEQAVVFLNELGQVDDAARRDLYLIADALLFTSEREGFGIPILEAGLARLPIFCSDIPPFRESAREWATFFALDESPDGIAERIAASLESDARYQLKRRVMREYAWPRIFRDKIEPLLKERSG